MVGFDSAGELSEETRDPRRTAPRAILRALIASGIGGALLLLAAILAAPSLTDGKLATGGLPYVLTSSLGDTVGKVFLADVTIAICVCTLAIQTAATRMMFSMSRDRVLPGHGALGRVSPVTGTPVLPAVVVGVLAAAILLVNVGEASLFTALTSVCIVMLYGAYLMVTVPMLVQRLRGTWAPQPGHFSLGGWGAVNLVAVAYGALQMVNLAWPRAVGLRPRRRALVPAVLLAAVRRRLVGGGVGRLRAAPARADRRRRGPGRRAARLAARERRRARRTAPGTTPGPRRGTVVEAMPTLPASAWPAARTGSTPRPDLGRGRRRRQLHQQGARARDDAAADRPGRATRARTCCSSTPTSRGSG